MKQLREVVQDTETLDGLRPGSLGELSCRGGRSGDSAGSGAESGLSRFPTRPQVPTVEVQRQYRLWLKKGTDAGQMRTGSPFSALIWQL